MIGTCSQQNFLLTLTILTGSVLALERLPNFHFFFYFLTKTYELQSVKTSLNDEGVKI